MGPLHMIRTMPHFVCLQKAKYAAAYVSHTYLANCPEYVGVTNVTKYYEYLKQMKFE